MAGGLRGVAYCKILRRRPLTSLEVLRRLQTPGTRLRCVPPLTDGAAAGTCAILPGESGYYLYAFQIREDLRGQGYGRDFLLGMLALLAADRSAPRQVSLQVSGLNGAARSLYKKTGFRDAEALSYYLY